LAEFFLHQASNLDTRKHESESIVEARNPATTLDTHSITSYFKLDIEQCVIANIASHLVETLTHVEEHFGDADDVFYSFLSAKRRFSVFINVHHFKLYGLYEIGYIYIYI